MAQKFIAVAIDKDRSSQSALKWAVDNLVSKGQTILLIHVKLQPPSGSSFTSTSSSIPRLDLISDGINEDGTLSGEINPAAKEIFLPFRVYCMRKDIRCQEIMLEDDDIVRAITEFVGRVGVEVLVLGAASKGSFFRFKQRDIPASVLKGVPNFCSVYIVSKGRVSSTSSANRPAPMMHPLRQQTLHQGSNKSTGSVAALPPTTNFKGSNRSEPDLAIYNLPDDHSSIKSPFTHRKAPNGMAYEISVPDTDISFVSSGRQSFDVLPSFTDSFESRLAPPRLSGYSDIDSHGYESYSGRRSMDTINTSELSYFSGLPASQTMDDMEAEMKRLKQELSQSMVKYSSASMEPLSATHKAMELQHWKTEEQQRLEEARLAEEAMALAEKLNANSKAAFEQAEVAQRIAELEAQKRYNAEMKALKDAEDKSKVQNRMAMSNVNYRKYTIEEIEIATNYFDISLKVGEGGYGPVYKCNLDHTPAAVKVLRPDAAEGRSQFQQEVEVLSCIRHPNMVLLLGACPEYGCLVYEYMSNGSLEDRLFRRGNTPPLSWQQRFLISAEIGSGLLFLHQTKPEPLVHRDLKPANILLDRNFVSKISDVGLARLVPASVSDTVTQYHMTSAAGTFCYIDPEYQQTGMLGIKSDTYSLGIIFLQILTGKPPMGLTHHDSDLTEEERVANEQAELVPLLTGGKLKSYQLKGVKWLISLWQNGLNGILADQMGLGKTIQTIAFLAHLKGNGLDGPYLVIAPLSTLSNWLNEINRFVPSVNAIIYHGDKKERDEIRRKHMPLTIGPKFPIVITSYEVALMDARRFLKHYTWKYCVVDEGHRLKNSKCKLVKELKYLRIENKLLLTGTPLQNNLAELWSLLNFILPDIFSSHEEFESWFDLSGKCNNEALKEELEEKRRSQVVAKLHGILRPFLLRRLKSEVELLLPRKKEILLYATMTEHQKNYQDHLVNKTLEMHLSKTIGYGGAGFKGKLNNLMIQLRKNCNHPDLLESAFNNSYNYPPVEEIVEQCGKFRLLEKLLSKLFARQHKVLVFSQWTKILDIMEYYFGEKGFEVCRIDGNVKLADRRKQIQEFNDVNSKYRIFLLSTRAGGLGINLTAADTCILYDSDWNPQMDLQAMDRCHRIGQTKPVHVYRLATAQSVECRILKRAFSKLKLEHVVIGKGQFQQERTKQNPSDVAEEDLLALLKDDENEEEKWIQTDISDDDLERVLDRSDLVGVANADGGALDFPATLLPLKGPGWEVIMPNITGGILSTLNS